jgi:hypothetical protein
MIHSRARALEYCGALGCCVVIAVCTLYVARSRAQSSINASPIYDITIPAGYRDWRLIAVGHLAGGSLKQLRAQLGNDIAIKAFREGKLPFPDGTIIAALHWNEALSDENNKVLASGFPAPASNLPLPGPPKMFNSWSRTQKSMPRVAAGDSRTSRTANLATRRCIKPASPATSLPKIAIWSSRATRLRPELKHARRRSHRAPAPSHRSPADAISSGQP